MRGQIGLPKRHAAADVVANQRGVKMPDAKKSRADGITAPRMQIGHARHALHVRQFGGGFQLLNGVAFYPGV